MSSQAIRTCGVMESGGSYNRHARIQVAGAHLALPHLEQAVREIPLDGAAQPVVIADYGSSQGKNSLTPMRAAIAAVRARTGPDKPILVAHIDQAANDFNTLFDVLHRDPERYSADDPNVFPFAIGRSFYERVLPDQHVDFGWCSYAAVWLSSIPSLVPGHFVGIWGQGEVLAKFERQAADDWKLFLSLRANELKPGGRLVIVLPARNDDGIAGLEPLFTCANNSFAELVSEGAITAEERSRLVLGCYPRRTDELLAPFLKGGEFDGLTVELCELSAVANSAWAEYERDHDAEALAARHAHFFRSAFAPSLASTFPDPERGAIFADLFEAKMKLYLTDHPEPLPSFVQTMVLAKKFPVKHQDAKR
jgi:hypothetical protein